MPCCKVIYTNMVNGIVLSMTMRRKTRTTAMSMVALGTLAMATDSPYRFNAFVEQY